MRSFKVRGIRVHSDGNSSSVYVSLHLPAYKNLLIVLGISDTFRVALDANRNTETGQIGPFFWVATRNRASRDSFWTALWNDPFPHIPARGI